MSNFETFATVTEGNISTAQNIFVASTTDSLATILGAGYLNDQKSRIKLNDRVFINYADLSHFPLNTLESTITGEFRVNYDPSANNWNLIALSANQSNISAMGVHSARYNNAGGSATTVISDPNINPNAYVFGNWLSSANGVGVETVVAGNGTVTVVSTGDPGASVFSYIAILPSLLLQNLGVYVNTYSNAGGSATITITDANITAAMVVKANFVSQANASYIEKVTVAAGSITILCNTNPGVSVINYVATTPSSALTALGFYAADYTNAGGSATTTVTDATITSSSVVVANWEASANAVYIEKVTPGAGSLVILSSGDPGASVLAYTATLAQEGNASGQYLLAANNLSDVASASTSLANLGGLPLAGGQMTGQLLFDRGTATSTAGAATINHQVGIITTEALTTAAASAYSFTYTNSRILTTSIIHVQLMGGTNTTRGIEIRAVITGAGSATLSFFNNNVAAAALNGTLIFGVTVI